MLEIPSILILPMFFLMFSHAFPMVFPRGFPLKFHPKVLVAIQRHVRAPLRAQKGARLAQEQHHLPAPNGAAGPGAAAVGLVDYTWP